MESSGLKETLDSTGYTLDVGLTTFSVLKETPNTLIFLQKNIFHQRWGGHIWHNYNLGIGMCKFLPVSFFYSALFCSKKHWCCPLLRCWKVCVYREAFSVVSVFTEGSNRSIVGTPARHVEHSKVPLKQCSYVMCIVSIQSFDTMCIVHKGGKNGQWPWVLGTCRFESS